MITESELKAAIRTIPDFPEPGIQFKDLTTLLKKPELFRHVLETSVSYYRDKGITRVVAIESRGFILGGAMAAMLGTGFIPIRKPGKLPAPVYRKSYALEYGEDAVEIHKDALSPEDTVLLHDDLLATGGTARAAIELIRKFGVQKIYVNFIVELDALKGRDKLAPACDVFSQVHY